MIVRWSWREWRSPSLLIVWLVLSLAVVCVLVLESISDRMEKGLNQQSREFIAGDRTLCSSREVPTEWTAQARRSGLTVDGQLSFAIITFAGDTPQLANVKTVDDRYPLYGTLKTQLPGLKSQAGGVLLAPGLMASLNLKTGDTIDAGDATLRTAGEVTQEPDAGPNPFQMVPWPMMNMADVAKIRVVQPGSRVARRYKLVGNAQQLMDYEQWLLPKLGAEHRWTSLEQDGSALGKPPERLQQFLLLFALLTLPSAVVAIAVVINHHCRSRYDLVAILKMLGAGRTQLRKLIVGQWLLPLTPSVTSGGAVGPALERLLLLILKPVLPVALPVVSGWPWLQAIGTTGAISLLVGLWPYRLLLATLSLRVPRQGVVANAWPPKYYTPMVCAAVVDGLVRLMGGSPLLWSVLARAVVLALLCGLVGWGLLWLLKRLTFKALPLCLAVNRLLRQPRSTLNQLTALSLSFMLLVLLLVLRGDLLDRWQQQLPPQSPNYFLINIASEQIMPVETFLAEHRTRATEFYPIARARLTQINGYSTNGNKDETLNRELNFTWSEQRPDHNPLVAGSWPSKPGEVSIEEGPVQRLGAKIGDTVTSTGDIRDFGAKVSSVRKVDWESPRSNFFFIFSSGALDGQSQSWFTSFRQDNDPAMLTQLNREFPIVSLLDIGAILRQAGQVFFQASRALEAMMDLVTVCGALLLLAQVQVGMRRQHQGLVVWRTLEAGESLLRAMLQAEFALLGLVSGLVAAIGAEVTLAMLQTKVFDFPWTPDRRLWGMLPLTGAVLLSLCGGGLGLRLLKGKALFRQFSQ